MQATKVPVAENGVAITGNGDLELRPLMGRAAESAKQVSQGGASRRSIATLCRRPWPIPFKEAQFRKNFV